MARGARTRRPGIGLGAHRNLRAAGTGASGAPNIDLELARAEAAARTTLREISAAVEAGERHDFMKHWEVGYHRGGGILGDERQPAEDLWSLAHMHIDAGDSAHGRRTLERAARHQERHIELFAEAVAHPRRKASQGLLQELNMVGSGAPAMRQRFLDARRTDLELIREQLAMSDQELSKLRKTRPFTFHRPLALALARRFSGEMRDQIDAGRGDDELLLFVRGYATRIADGGPSHMDDLERSEVDYLRRLVLLPSKFRADGDIAVVLTPGTAERAGDTGRDLKEAVVRHGAWRGINVAGVSPAPERNIAQLMLPRAESDMQIRRLWRGLLSDMPFHASRTPPSTGRRRLQTVVAATHDAVAALIADGAEPIVLRASSVAKLRDHHYETTYPEGADEDTDGAQLWAGARLRAKQDDVQVECCAAFPLGVSTKARFPHSILNDGLSRVEEWPEWLPVDDPTLAVVHWSSAAVAGYGGHGEEPAWANAPALSDVLGPPACDHRGATWAPGTPYQECGANWGPRRPRTPDTAVLSCPSCLNRRVATVPAHRLPDDHPQLAAARKNEDDYLDLQHAAEVLAGQSATRAGSIDELRARDGLADPDPQAYAQTPELPRPARTSRRMIGMAARTPHAR